MRAELRARRLDSGRREVDCADRPAAFGKMERFAFYDRSKQAFAVVASGESRLYGCLLLKKGVIRPG